MSYFNVKDSIEELKKTLNDSSDFSYRYYKNDSQTLGLIFLKSIIDQELLSSAIYYPLQTFDKNFSFEDIEDKILKCADMKEIEKKDIICEILDGKVILITDFSEKILAIDILKFPERVPSEPPTSPVLQGPREGFIEDLQTNI